jgi:hypothetical protein
MLFWVPSAAAGVAIPDLRFAEAFHKSLSSLSKAAR